MRTRFAYIATIATLSLALSSTTSFAEENIKAPVESLTFEQVINIANSDLSAVKSAVVTTHRKLAADVFAKILLDKKIALYLIENEPALIASPEKVVQYLKTKVEYTVELVNLFAEIAKFERTSPTGIAYLEILQRVFPGEFGSDTLSTVAALIEANIRIIDASIPLKSDSQFQILFGQLKVKFKAAQTKLFNVI